MRLLTKLWFPRGNWGKWTERRRQKTDGRAPGSGASTDVKKGSRRLSEAEMPDPKIFEPPSVYSSSYILSVLKSAEPFRIIQTGTCCMLWWDNSASRYPEIRAIRKEAISSRGSIKSDIDLLCLLVHFFRSFINYEQIFIMNKNVDNCSLL